MASDQAVVRRGLRRVVLPHWSVLLNGQLVGLGTVFIQVQFADRSLEQATAVGLAWGVGFGVGLWLGYHVAVLLLLWTKRHITRQDQRIDTLFAVLDIDKAALPANEQPTRYRWWRFAWWPLYWALSNLASCSLVWMFLMPGSSPGIGTVVYGVLFWAVVLVMTGCLFYAPIIRAEWQLRQLEAKILCPEGPRAPADTRRLGAVQGIKYLSRYIDRVTAWPVRLSLGMSR